MKILIAEDPAYAWPGLKNKLIQSGIATAVEEARDGREAVKKARDFGPDLFILDFEMPDYDALYACDIIKAKWPHTPVIVLSRYQTHHVVLEAFEAKVNGIVFKEAPVEELIRAIRNIIRGKKWFKGAVAEIIAESISENEEAETMKQHRYKLTARELELLNHFIQGANSKETAEQLKISKRTVDVHKANMFKKLGVNSTPKLISYAIKKKIVEI